MNQTPIGSFGFFTVVLTGQVVSLAVDGDLAAVSNLVTDVVGDSFSHGGRPFKNSDRVRIGYNDRFCVSPR